MVERHLAMVEVAGSNPVFRLLPIFAGVAELADARDLKSRGHFCPYRFEPDPRHHILHH